LKEAIEKVGSEKLIFGSEFPMSTASIQAFQIKQLDCDIQKKIFSENIKKIIPILNN